MLTVFQVAKTTCKPNAHHLPAQKPSEADSYGVFFRQSPLGFRQVDPTRSIGLQHVLLIQAFNCPIVWVAKVLLMKDQYTVLWANETEKGTKQETQQNKQEQKTSKKHLH